ncbi:MAG: hypothetical protein L3J05_06030 [Robiginitomaculum sp.]|nr:hypothetical protein [Robiginitomaculum sp.]
MQFVHYQQFYCPGVLGSVTVAAAMLALLPMLIVAHMAVNTAKRHMARMVVAAELVVMVPDTVQMDMGLLDMALVAEWATVWAAVTAQMDTVWAQALLDARGDAREAFAAFKALALMAQALAAQVCPVQGWVVTELALEITARAA